MASLEIFEDSKKILAGIEATKKLSPLVGRAIGYSSDGGMVFGGKEKL